jgi:hypothetical protein
VTGMAAICVRYKWLRAPATKSLNEIISLLTPRNTTPNARIKLKRLYPTL